MSFLIGPCKVSFDEIRPIPPSTSNFLLAYARQFLGGLERPKVDKISGLSPRRRGIMQGMDSRNGARCQFVYTKRIVHEKIYPCPIK